MRELLEANLDYILFLHGVVLVTLTATAWDFYRGRKYRPWFWLSVGWGLQALHVWLQIFAVDHRDSQSFAFFRQCILSISYLALLESARVSAAEKYKWLKPWFILVVPVGVACGILFTQQIDSWMIYGLFLPAGGAASTNLWLRSHHKSIHRPRKKLRAVALALLACTLVQAVRVIPESSIGTIVEQPDSASDFIAGIYLQVLKIILSGVLTASLVIYYRSRWDDQLVNERNSLLRRTLTGSLLALFLVLVSGWIALDLVSKQKDASMRSDVLVRAQLVSAAVSNDDAKQLYWNDQDLTNPSYARLKNLMCSLVGANNDLRFVLLAGIQEGRCYFLADSEQPDSKDYSPPGQYYDEADPAYIKGMASRLPFVLGPVTDRWGTWILASVPLVKADTDHGKISAEIDIKAQDWDQRIREARLPVVLITGSISALLFIFWQGQRRITESHTQLVDSEQRNVSLVEGSPNCVQLFDGSGRCTAINKHGLRVLARQREEIIGHQFIDMWPDDQRKIVHASLERTKKGHATLFEANYLRPNGDLVIWRVSLTPVFSHRREVKNIVSISVDITDFKLSEKALVAAKEAAETATRTKSEFLAVMSHEIRTPLGGVIGMLNVLRKHHMGPEQQLYTDLARDNAEGLLSLLDNLLDAAKIEAGKLTIEKIPFDPIHEFDHVFTPMKIRTEAKGLKFKHTIATNMPPVLLGDPTRLRQVLSNLLSNAIKFTESGSIKTTITAASKVSDKVTLCIRVSDTGIGIPLDVISRLFARFEQADSSTTRRYGGTGLGLSIIKNLAELMNGDINVDSVPGSGSTFTFYATLERGTEKDLAILEETKVHTPPVLPLHRARLHILCVEDDTTNQIAAEFLIKQMGHTVEFAENGQQAIEWLSSQRTGVILMDNRMPIMDGFQATQIIRDPSSKVLDHTVYIIANTANATSGYRERCLSVGMNDYLTKPLREDKLHAALDRAITFYERQGIVLPKMDVSEQAVRKHFNSVPPQSMGNTRPIPVGMSEAQLLAIIDEAETEPATSANQLSPEAVQRITDQFFKEAPQRLAEIRSSLEKSDTETLARAAHSLKSTSRYVQANDLSALGAEMERLADAKQLGEIPDLLIQAEMEFAKLPKPEIT